MANATEADVQLGTLQAAVEITPHGLQVRWNDPMVSRGAQYCLESLHSDGFDFHCHLEGSLHTGVLWVKGKREKWLVYGLRLKGTGANIVLDEVLFMLRVFNARQAIVSRSQSVDFEHGSIAQAIAGLFRRYRALPERFEEAIVLKALLADSYDSRIVTLLAGLIDQATRRPHK